MSSIDVHLEQFEYCNVCGTLTDIVVRFNQFKYHPRPDSYPKEYALIDVCEPCARKMVGLLELNRNWED